MLEETSNELLLSAASSWEIAIKYSLGRLSLPEPPETYVPSRIQRSGVTPLRIEHSHALAVASLPMHHRDPFDRLLIAQARDLDIGIMTIDDSLRAYDVTIHWAA